MQVHAHVQQIGLPQEGINDILSSLFYTKGTPVNLGFYESQLADFLRNERARKKKQQLRSGIGPADMLRAIETVLPAWMRTSKVRPSWRGIEAYAREMVKRSESYKNATAGHQLYVAGQDILGLLPRFWRRRREASVSSDWDFCPLCWRPVLAQSHLMRPEHCSLHKTRTPEYQRLDRLLRKLKYFRRDHVYGTIVADRLPPDYPAFVRQIIARNISREEELRLSWSLFPFTRERLNQLRVNLMDVKKCFAALAQPEVLLLDKASPTTPSSHSGVLLPWEDVYRPMLIRSEAWLWLLSEVRAHVQPDGTLSLKRGRPTKP
ncbi:MAG: hypothetical protein ACEB74_14730 [Desulfovibrio aminophilus]|uniref:hypothetical protein n=1 Tax=Desulfovibrio aminophilus TaxID=81425 RepID=UPI0039E8EDF6